MPINFYIKRHILIYVIFFALITMLFGFIEYQTEYKKQLEFTDRFLLTIAKTTDSSLNFKQLHANLTPKTQPQEHELISTQDLAELTHKIGAAYIYSLILTKAGELRFVTSSPSPGELQSGQYERVYWTTYDEADPNLYNAINQQITTYAQYKDRWGTFRSVFFPGIAKDGTKYVIGVDIPVQAVTSIAKSSMLYAIAKSTLIGLLIIPFIYFSLRAAIAAWHVKETTFFIDETTNLPNKNALMRDLLKVDQPHLLVLNIDRFREVANGFSLGFGDQMLSQFGHCLTAFFHPDIKSLRAYRLHSDEFAVLAEHDLDKEGRKRLFWAYYQFITTRQFRLPDETYMTFNLHIGVVDGIKQEAFALAEMALRMAQDSNRSVVLYNEASDLPLQYRDSLDQTEQVKAAVNENRFEPFYHPIVDPKTNKIEKYEVLARMVNERGEVVMMPDLFLPILYRTRLYTRFTRTLFQQVLLDIADNDTHISFNISTRDITDKNSFNKLIKLIAKSGKGKQLHFELLEADSLLPLDELSEAIEKIKQFGCRVGLDDLGREYSNFDRLMALPIDFVKLDRSVMPNIVSSEESLEIVENIIEFARKKNITTVAEYCCDKQTCQVATEIGIDYLQGFWYAVPQRTFCELDNKL